MLLLVFGFLSPHPNQYLLSTYNVPGIVLRLEIRETKIPASWCLRHGERQTVS